MIILLKVPIGFIQNTAVVLLFQLVPVGIYSQRYWLKVMNKELLPILIGGLGEKVSNGGTQYYNQDRVYSSFTVSVAIATAYQPWYLVKIKDEKDMGL